ncbi:MAG: CYTH domain-containing protein [Oscillospiraceae bacterium]|nr:CYTH domain-containing protein [Oscillospiraceae bacterium]
MGIEFELKYRATEDIQARIAQGIDTWQTISMETTYYDTPDQALSQKWYTLRRRLENGASVCTLKCPAQGGGRGEWEVEAERVEQAIPELCKLGAPADLRSLTREGVMPVCGARFTRRAATVTLGDTVLELALDSGSLFSGKRQIPLCEVEVELKQGERAQAMAYGKLLAQKYGLVPDKKSKFRRALALWREEQNGTAE